MAGSSRRTAATARGPRAKPVPVRPRRAARMTPPAAGAFHVEIVDRQRRLAVARPWLAGIIRAALARQGVAAAEICVLLVDDRRIATLHERWLGVPGPTDVITFDLGSQPDALRGDIAVSAETAARVAREIGCEPRRELAYYVVHGLLHLAGHDDHTAADRRRMRARERLLMQAAGLPPPAAAARGRR